MRLVIFTTSIILTYGLTACSYVAKGFPDKEKDYQHNKEIPMLTWPTELRTSPAPLPPAVPGTTTPPSNPDSQPPATDNTPQTPETLAPNQPAPTSVAPVVEPTVPEADTTPPEDSIPKPFAIEQVKRDGTSRLRINVPKNKTWRLLGKALSHNSIEITGREQEQSLFVIQYDPDEKKFNDGSFMDEINFILHGFPNNEQEYRLKIEEGHDFTEIVNISNDQKPTPDTQATLKLLDLLEKTIKADMSAPSKD